MIRIVFRVNINPFAPQSPLPYKIERRSGSGAGNQIIINVSSPAVLNAGLVLNAIKGIIAAGEVQASTVGYLEFDYMGLGPIEAEFRANQALVTDARNLRNSFARGARMIFIYCGPSSAEQFLRGVFQMP